MGVRPCGDAHFTESVYDQKTAQASVRLKTKVWNPKKRQSKNFRGVIEICSMIRDGLK
jgi:hypothetical protein